MDPISESWPQVLYWWLKKSERYMMCITCLSRGQSFKSKFDRNAYRESRKIRYTHPQVSLFRQRQPVTRIAEQACTSNHESAQHPKPFRWHFWAQQAIMWGMHSLWDVSSFWTNARGSAWPVNVYSCLSVCIVWATRSLRRATHAWHLIARTVPKLSFFLYYWIKASRSCCICASCNKSYSITVAEVNKF
jgi:hypothetical protein